MKQWTDIISHKFNNDIIVYPIADVHFGSIGHNESAWNQFCKQILNQENTYITLGGDLINNGTRNSVSGPFDDTIRPREQKRIMAEMLMPLRERILCAIPGNHEARSGKDADDDPMYDIMCKLDLEDLYRDEMAYLKINIMNQNTNDKNAVYTVGVIHGSGGGIYTGTSVNRNERFGNTIEGLDCLIVGHSHKAFVTRPKKIIFDSNKEIIRFSHYVVISASPWLSYGGYGLRKMMLPSEDSIPQKLLFKNDATHKHKKIEVIW